MRITILTLFPEMFTGAFSHSMLKRAQDKKLHDTPPLEIGIINIRDFATDKHQTTDDRPYGGGAGMVMKVEPIDLALQYVLSPSRGRTQASYLKETRLIREGESSKSQITASKSSTKIILTSAKGKLFGQQTAQVYSQLDHLVIICGHYEGVDQRVADHLVDEEVRIGDYVLTGGEPAAAVITDAVARLLPGVLGNDVSATHESHSEPGYLEHPQYTRPEKYNDWEVPKVLLQGNHKEIDDWRSKK